MNRLSFRMILCIVVLSALHISAIAPQKPAAIRLLQETPLQLIVQTRDSPSSNQIIGPIHAH
jgi:hypothetical protein